MLLTLNKIVCELKLLEMVYSNALQVRKLVKSLPKVWETKTSILEEGDLQIITYDELRGNLIAYELNHINRYNKNDKKIILAFMAETTDIEEEVDEYQCEGMTLIYKGVEKVLRQRRQRPQQEFGKNEFQRNDDQCYYCGKLGHIKKNSPKRLIRII